MTRASDELHFFYDAQNRPAVVVYNGTAYAYVKSLQGDIVAILDENGNAVVSYGYDAWGAPLWCTGELAETLGKVQPFRYRGYVFDEETGLYYLRSRYYNAQWGRFVNADAILYATTIAASFNQYCYCSCEPIRHKDSNGYRASRHEPQSIQKCECYNGMPRSERIDSSSLTAPLFYNPATDSRGFNDVECSLLYEEHYIISLSNEEASTLSKGIIRNIEIMNLIDSIRLSVAIGTLASGVSSLFSLSYMPSLAVGTGTTVASSVWSYATGRDPSDGYIAPQNIHISIAHYDASAIAPGFEYIIFKVSSEYSNMLNSDWSYLDGKQSSEYDTMDAICDILWFDCLD